METLPLGPDTVGALVYELLGPDHETLESISKEAPLRFLVGAGALVPGLEKALMGRMPGARFRVELGPTEAFGEHDPEKVFYVPRSNFPEGAPLEPGTPMQATTDEGEEVTFWITAVEDDRVVVNENHPLAGIDLIYIVELLGVRPATDEERTTGKLLADKTEPHQKPPTGAQGST
ncbi:MAG: FKBP-type peptidyl-prolyl cis-trans isomerase 2 [Planctomycetota bacterium]|jgi:FKBP-type peptidyl-prolyl cis-trans isomerase 2